MIDPCDWTWRWTNSCEACLYCERTASADTSALSGSVCVRNVLVSVHSSGMCGLFSHNVLFFVDIYLQIWAKWPLLFFLSLFFLFLFLFLFIWVGLGVLFFSMLPRGEKKKLRLMCSDFCSVGLGMNLKLIHVLFTLLQNASLYVNYESFEIVFTDF